MGAWRIERQERQAMTIVTYVNAYIPGAHDLCADHAEDPPEWLPALGAVEHGAHEGECAVCGADVHCPVCGEPMGTIADGTDEAYPCALCEGVAS